MKKNIVLITIALLSVLLIVSCSNKTQGSKAVGLSIGRVETVFAENCVAVVFIVAIILNLILPKNMGENEADRQP